MQNLITLIVSAIFVTFPIIIATGPFLTDAGIIIIGIYFIASTVYNKNYKIFSSIIFKLILFFWIYCIFVSLISSNIMLSLESSLFYGRFILFAMGVGLIIDNNNKLLNYFFITLIITLSFISFDALFQSIYDVNLLGIEKSHSTRISGIFKDELILGSYLSRLFPLIFLTLPMFFKNKNKIEDYIRIFLIILIGSVIYNSGERSAFGYYFITLLMVMILIPIYRKTIIYSSLVVFISISSISYFQPDVKDRMFNVTMKNLVAGFKENNRIFIFSEKHEAHYKVAWEMFKDKKIFGHGPKLFRETCKNYDEFGCSTHPHNTYMQLLSETGIIGFLFFLIILLYVCFYFAKHLMSELYNKQSKDNNNKIIILIAAFISLFPIIPTGNFFGNWLNAIYYIPIGILLFINFRNIETETKIKNLY